MVSCSVAQKLSQGSIEAPYLELIYAGARPSKVNQLPARTLEKIAQS